MSYNLKVILDGLNLVAADHEDRVRMFADPEFMLDENFDFIVLDSLQGAVASGEVSAATARKIEVLFREADKLLSSLSWQQEDRLLELKPPVVQGWQALAKELASEVKAHNK